MGARSSIEPVNEQFLMLLYKQDMLLKIQVQTITSKEFFFMKMDDVRESAQLTCRGQNQGV